MTRDAIATVVVVAALAVGCGKDSPAGSAVAPSPTTSAVAVTVTTPLRVAQTTQVAGTASLSNGQTQPVTSGWRSDVPSVATVTDAGLITGVTNGLANIYVVTGGRQGQAQIRVVPDYHGRWAGRLQVTSCIQSGSWTTVGFCSEFPTGFSDPFSLSMTQTGEQISATASYGGNLTFPMVASFIQPDGASSFASTFVSPTSSIAIEASWNISSQRANDLSGTVTEVWRAPGVPGEGRLVQDIVGALRTSATPLSADGGATRSSKTPRVVTPLHR